MLRRVERRTIGRLGSCSYHVLIYSNAKYITANSRGVCRGFVRVTGSTPKIAVRFKPRSGSTRMNMGGAKYRNIYRLKPLIHVRGNSSIVRCAGIRVRSYRRVFRGDIRNGRAVRELLCRGNNGMDHKPRSVPFVTGRAHVILGGYNGFSTRSLGRCVTDNNFRTLRGTVFRVSPSLIVSRISGSNVHKHNNNNFPTNGG